MRFLPAFAPLRLMAAILFVGCMSTGGNNGARPDADTAITRVFADEDWFRSRQEPQSIRAGTLRYTPMPVTRSGRVGLDFTLTTESEKLPVYAAGVKEILMPFTDRRVLTQGKVVTVLDGQELWIAEISFAP